MTTRREVTVENYTYYVNDDGYVMQTKERFLRPGVSLGYYADAAALIRHDHLFLLLNDLYVRAFYIELNETFRTRIYPVKTLREGEQTPVGWFIDTETKSVFMLHKGGEMQFRNDNEIQTITAECGELVTTRVDYNFYDFISGRKDATNTFGQFVHCTDDDTTERIPRIMNILGATQWRIVNKEDRKYVAGEHGICASTSIKGYRD